MFAEEKRAWKWEIEQIRLKEFEFEVYRKHPWTSSVQILVVEWRYLKYLTNDCTYIGDITYNSLLNILNTFTLPPESGPNSLMDACDKEDGHTHQWTVYVKPYNNEDMSTYVKKVHFKLHESYNNPNRIVTKPPYELTETGWGEFEIVIKIYFHDPNERPVSEQVRHETERYFPNLITILSVIKNVWINFRLQYIIYWNCFNRRPRYS